MTITLDQIRSSMALEGFDGPSAHYRMRPLPRITKRSPDRPGKAREGSVLLMLYPENGSIDLVLTRRRDDLRSHPGQVSFPGGRREEGERLLDTALRETREEIGVDPGCIEILGELTPIYVAPSDFEVVPYVGWHSSGRPDFIAQEAEVAEVIEVPLQSFFASDLRSSQEMKFGDVALQVPYYSVDHYRVWGATAMILSEFLARLESTSSVT